MTVKKVADRYGVTGETLRYYEWVGMLPPVTRTAGGIRDYTAEDLKWVGPMLCMRKAGLPPEAIIEYVRLYREGDGTFAARLAFLQEQRQAPIDQKRTIDETPARLDVKIGRAAAMLFVKAGVHAVFAEVMSDGAAALLAAHGIDASCDVRTAAIEDRQKTGPCPMESAVAGIEDIDAGIAAIRRRAEELRAGH